MLVNFYHELDRNTRVWHTHPNSGNSPPTPPLDQFPKNVKKYPYMGKQTAISGKPTPISQVDRDSLSYIEETLHIHSLCPCLLTTGRGVTKGQ